MQRIHQNPWELFSSLTRDADRLFQLSRDATPAFVPAVDIHEEAERYRVQADLPGIDPAEIEITVEGDLLTIKGERKAATLIEGATVQRSERASGNFERVFRLPESAASEGFEADYRLGVLTVSIPKAAAKTPYRIKVTAN